MKRSSKGFTKNDKSKKIWLIPTAVILILLVCVGGYIGYTRWQESREAQLRQTRAETLTDQYLEALRSEEMVDLVDLLSEDSIATSSYSKEEITERYQNVFSVIGATNLNETMSELRLDEETDTYHFDYTLSMDTSLGTINDLEYKTTLYEDEETMSVNWDTTLIFPELEQGDLVRISYEEGNRGSLNDRNGNLLAGNGDAWQAGLFPSSLGEGSARAENLNRIAETLNQEVSTLEGLLEQSWVNEDSFVPFTVVEEGNRPELSGVRYQQTASRVYPLSEAAAHLTGYVGQATAEDIEANPTLQTGDILGKSGLEAAFDQRLRGTKGGRIFIESEEGEQKSALIESEIKDGENIRLTIDIDLQQSFYDQLQGEPGTAVVMDPDTGELLVAASSPSYDPQLFVRGISSEDYQNYNNDPNTPFVARYAARYAPGSTFKILTSMIGLDTGVTTPEKTHTIEGLQWSPNDDSFGGHQITRVSDAVTEVDLQAAITYSDNIYFAMEALEMGGDTFVKELSQFPFGASMNLPFSMQPAQISNDGALSRPTLLADTAYGQGELLMSPIHQISFYSAVANDGMMTFPTLVMDEESGANQLTPVSLESAEIVREDLIRAVEDTNGTAHPFASLPFQVGAKTGTAEIEKDGENVTNGFVYALDAEDNDFTFIGFLEGKSSGDVVERFLPILPELKDTE